MNRRQALEIIMVTGAVLAIGDSPKKRIKGRRYEDNLLYSLPNRSVPERRIQGIR
jgi:hypothetical protein